MVIPPPHFSVGLPGQAQSGCGPLGLQPTAHCASSTRFEISLSFCPQKHCVPHSTPFRKRSSNFNAGNLYVCIGVSVVPVAVHLFTNNSDDWTTYHCTCSCPERGRCLRNLSGAAAQVVQVRKFASCNYMWVCQGDRRVHRVPTTHTRGLAWPVHMLGTPSHP